ncbi:MAG: CNNM domain-containing protein [Chthoniobacterales bacterium]
MIWLLIAALGAVSFLFAGIEAGLLSVDPLALRHHVKQKTPGAPRLARLLEEPERLLVSVLLVTAVADISALFLATGVLVRTFGPLGYFISVAAAVPILLCLLRVLPTSLFRRFPLRILAALGGLLENAALVLWPVLEIGQRLGRIFLPRRNSTRGRLFAAREELKQVAVQSEREGSLTATERAMIHNVVDYRHVRVRDVMVPLEQCTSLRPDAALDAVLQLSSSTGMDRFPVIAESGDAVGLVNVLDILFDPSRGGSLVKYTRRIVIAAENEPAYRIIRRLRAARLGLAAIVDTNRKLIGIATDEALIKRLVQST